MQNQKKLTADILSIGDELLIGQTVNTNAAWMGEILNQRGIQVRRAAAIADDAVAISENIQKSMNEVQFTFITGGLGPTKDDITKKTICDLFQDHLVEDPATLERVKAFFAQRNQPLLPVNMQQALVPSQCHVVPNEQGTAPGMWFNSGGKILVSMPGVPYEMKAMMEKEILPKIQREFELPTIVHRTIMTVGVGESFISEKLEIVEQELEKDQIKLAYLPSPGLVKLRLSSYHNSNQAEAEARVEKQVDRLIAVLGSIVYSNSEKSIAEVVSELLVDRQHTVSAAESFTGGALASAFTQLPGASVHFMGSITAYQENAKIHVLGIDEETIKNHRVVSEEVAREMAEAVKNKFNTTYGLATTGNAGPTAGDPHAPVGKVCLACSGPQGTRSITLQLGTNRQRNIQMGVIRSLNLLRESILNIL